MLLVGKFLRGVLKIVRPNGGSALPGKVVETLDKDFMSKTLSRLPYGIIAVSGTNGKTTTTHMITQLLEGQGLKVFTNKSGSNFTRGVVSELISKVGLLGKLKADIAVLELDEAHGVHFVEQIKPQYTVLLNVMRDQLDRFGEIDNTAQMLTTIAKATTDSLILNREDHRIFQIKDQVSKETAVYFFGIDESLRGLFLNDDELHSDQKPVFHEYQAAPKTWAAEQKFTPQNTVILQSFQKNEVAFSVNGHSFITSLQLKGIHNIFNATAAIATVRAVMKNDLNGPKLFEDLKLIEAAFGRGETLEVDGKTVDLVLVKNPAGFRLALLSFEPSDFETMFAVNDQYADGRDVSWYYDVDFSIIMKKSAKCRGISYITGRRAYDMALKLDYQKVAYQNIEPNIKQAVKQFLETGDKKKRIYATYTAMLEIRQLLTKEKAFD
jgi:UDP-N-acetylmuramyl tripeptide synthase